MSRQHSSLIIPELSDEERMALVLPKGCPGGEYLWKLLKSIYGLKQSGAKWAAEAGRMLRAEGFEQTRADVCVWVKKDEKGKLQCALLVHVDDFAVGASGTMIEECKAGVKRTYTVSDDGEMSWFLKVRVDWSADRQSVTLSQFDYTKDLLEKTGMWGANPRHVPAVPKSFLGGEKEPITEEERAEVEEMEGKWNHTYAQVVGMVGYLAARTRPSITGAVRRLQMRTKDVRPADCKEVEYLLRHLAGSPGHGIRFSLRKEDQRVQDPELMGWADADHAEDPETRRSMLGYVFTMCGGVVSWGCGQVDHTTRSSAESEISALDEAAREALYLRRLGMELGMEEAGCITVLEDNKAAERFANGGPVTDRIKHVDTLYYACRDNVANGELAVKGVPTEEQVADLFTKHLHTQKFVRFREAMGEVEVVDRNQWGGGARAPRLKARGGRGT